MYKLALINEIAMTANIPLHRVKKGFFFTISLFEDVKHICTKSKLKKKSKQQP